MPVTQIGNMVEPQVWQPYMTETTAEVSALFRSGVIQQNEEFDEMTSQKGQFVELPFFKDLARGSLDSGFASQKHTDSDTISVNARASGKQRAVKHRRADSWGTADLVQNVIGDDPLEGVAELIADFWASEIELAVLMTLNGLFKASGPLGSNNANHIVDIGAEDGTSDTKVTIAGPNDRAEPLIDAMNKLGDNWDNITAIAMHSKPFSDLQKANLIEFEPLDVQDLRIPRFMGRQVVVDDNLPYTPGTGSPAVDRYTTYLFGEGAVGYGEGSPEVPFETERDARENGGQEVIVSRRHFTAHVNGIQYSGDPADDTPTQSELETASDYSLEYESKNVHVTAVEHN